MELFLSLHRLSDLRAKRAQIDQAIAALEGLRADAPSSAVLAETDQIKPGDVSPGMFLGMNIADAANLVGELILFRSQGEVGSERVVSEPKL